MTYMQLPPRAKNITGQRFGRLVVLGPIRKTRQGIYWHCRCDCGNETQVRVSHLKNGFTRSCGCLRHELATVQSTTHGLSKTYPWRIWSHIIGRCTNPKDAAYEIYGGRGITICDEWRHDFQTFYDHVSQLPHYGDKGYSLDRTDNDGNYQPGNVRWATRNQQSQNRRSLKLLTYKGKTQCLAEWSRETGINEGTLRNRIKNGWAVERALLTPPRRILVAVTAKDKDRPDSRIAA